jgi:hypothetical protein
MVNANTEEFGSLRRRQHHGKVGDGVDRQAPGHGSDRS